MASEIRVNQIQSRTGVSTVSFTDTGPVISGVTTVQGTLTVDGSLNVGGDLTTPGVLTYDDVTNVDSIGIITARSGIHVGTGTSITSPSDNVLTLGTNNTEKVRITSAGQVKITGVDDQDNLLVNGGNSQFAVHQDDSDGEVSLRAQDGSGNNSTKYMTFFTEGGSGPTERLRITSDGHLVYDTNKGGIYNFDKACSSNASTNIFRIDNEHGAHCFTIYMTCSNSGNSVSKVYNVACQYGSSPTINSAADTGAYSSNNFSLTGSGSGKVHTFAISVTGAAATISCTVVLGSMNTSATVTVL